MGELMRTPYDWADDVMSQNRLAILPNVTHYVIFMSPALATTVLPLLDGKRDTASWSGEVMKP